MKAPNRPDRVAGATRCPKCRGTGEYCAECGESDLYCFCYTKGPRLGYVSKVCECGAVSPLPIRGRSGK